MQRTVAAMPEDTKLDTKYDDPMSGREVEMLFCAVER